MSVARHRPALLTARAPKGADAPMTRGEVGERGRAMPSGQVGRQRNIEPTRQQLVIHPVDGRRRRAGPRAMSRWAVFTRWAVGALLLPHSQRDVRGLLVEPAW
jgi:hypothetical protein